jgi:hypothetical protein
LSPGFSVAVVLTLGLVIGASTVVVSAADAVLLHPLPVSHLIGSSRSGTATRCSIATAGLQAAEVFSH